MLHLRRAISIGISTETAECRFLAFSQYRILGELPNDGRWSGALQSESVQLRQGLPLAAGYVGGRLGRAVELADVDATAGAVCLID